MPNDDPSPLDAVADAFAALVAGREPLALAGAAIGHGLPKRAIPLDELRAMLLHPSLPYPARDAAVGELLKRAKGDPDWLVGLAGVLMPGLRRIAGRVARDFPGEAADIDAEIVASFVEAVHTLDPRGGRLASRLLGIPWNRAKVARRAEMANIARHTSVTASAAPPRPWGHPDLVLDRAVAAGVITTAEAELIGATRLGDVDLASVAADIGVGYETLRRRRFRAERRLVAWMANESSPVPNETVKGICRCGSTSGDRKPAGRRCAVAHATKEVIPPPPARIPSARPAPSIDRTRTERSQP